MKKIIIIIGVLFAFFTLVSCDNTSSTSSTVSSETSSIASSSSSESSSSTEISSSSDEYGDVTHNTYEEFASGDLGHKYNLIATVKARTEFVPTKNVDTRYVVEGNMASAVFSVEDNDLKAFTIYIDQISDLYIHNGAVVLIRGTKIDSFGEIVLSEVSLVSVLKSVTVYNEKAIDHSAMTDQITISNEDGTFHNDTATYSGKLSTEDITVSRDEYYTDYLHVALYIYVFEHLPFNYHLKEDFYFIPTGSDIIGGNCFDTNPNPSNKVTGQFTECDVDNFGSGRGTNRIVFSRDMTKRYIYHTVDHYYTYTLIQFNA